jgi:Protein of unknown function (DUF2786)
MDSQTVLDKVRKLLKLASNNPSQQEAEAAAGKAQELIAQYQLSEALLSLDSTPEQADTEAIVDFGKMGAALDPESRARWRGVLSVYVADVNACKMYKNRDGLHIVGRPSDVDTVRYLYAYLVAQVDGLARHHGRGCGVTWQNNFRLGVVETLGVRLKAAKRKVEDEARAGATGTALVRVDQALARIERRMQRTEAAMAEYHPKLRKASYSGVTYNPTARAQGRIAGESINLSRASRNLGAGRRDLLN